MSKTDVLTQSKVLWITNLCVALSPLFFTVFILERERYQNVREKLIGEVSDYQTILLSAFVMVSLLLMYKGYVFFKNVREFGLIGESLSNERIVEYSSILSRQLRGFVGTANLCLLLVIPYYLSGIGYIFASLLSVPGIIAYVLCYKYYYLKLTKKC